MAQPSDLSNVFQSNMNAMHNRYNAPADALNSATKYLADQAGQVQQLQIQQAQDLSKARTMAQLYYPQAIPQVESMMAQNPYARRAFPQASLSQAGQPQQQPMGGNPNMFGSMIGAPGTNIYGNGIFPTPGGSPTPSVGGSMSPMNPVNAPVSTGGSVTSGGMEPPKISQSFTNPAAEAQVQSAKTGAETMTTAQTEANIGATKDAQQLGMIKNAIKPLAESYDKVYNSKVGGILPAGGDIYGSTIVKNADMLPRAIQSSVVNPDTQQAAGQFLANKNELVTKLQPLLSQQFGKDGSSRIMESLLNMSQNEIGDLNTPRDQFHGQLTGTISSLYRIAKAAQAYKTDLDTSGQPAPDPQVAASEIFRRMNLQAQSPQEQKELQGMIDETLGNKKMGGATGSFSGSMNPVSQAKPQANKMPSYNPKTQKVQQNSRTGEYRVVNL